MEQIRADIREFRQSSGVDKVIVLWTANTERFCDIIPGVNDSAKNLLAAIQVRAEVWFDSCEVQELKAQTLKLFPEEIRYERL